MKHLINILVGLFLLMPMFILAQKNDKPTPNSPQRPVCGTEFTPELEQRLRENIRVSEALGLPNTSASRVIRYVPIQFHLVANSNGTGRVSREKVFEALCRLNQNYLDQDIQFYLAGDFNEVNNSTINTHSNVSAARFQMSVVANNYPDALNVFLCTTVNSSSGGSGIVLGYYTSQYDIVVIRNSQMNSTSTTMTHEVGHFFSLPHPFLGWEAYDYHCSLGNYSASNPCPNPGGVTYGASNPPPASIGGALVERADGSNCATAGDLFCDTPPDYGLGNTVGGCNYNLGAVDPTGVAINPDETLYMSYFSDNCQSKFTTGQKGAIAADLNSSARNFLTNNPPSTTTPVTGTPTLQFPVNNGVPANYNSVTLDWDNVPGATHYFIQIARTSSFSILHEEKVVTSSAYTTTTLQSNTTYYWRVMAYNEVSTCNNFSAGFQFQTNTFPVGTQTITGLRRISLQPNVAANGQLVQLNVVTDERIEATVRVFNVSGQIVQTNENVTFLSGENVYELSTSDLKAGVYIVNILTQSGQINEKLVITSNH